MPNAKRDPKPKKIGAKAIYETLKNDIIHFVFKPGERLIESNLSERYSVSRTPIREALRRLEEESLIISKGNRGCFVPHFDVNAYSELYKVRVALEKLAVVEACRNASEDNVQLLRANWQGEFAEKNVATDGSFVSANERFHLGLARLSTNHYLADLLQRILDRTRIISVVDFTTVERVEATRSEHDEILRAILQRDMKSAETLIENHIQASEESIRQLIAKALEKIYLGEQIHPVGLASGPVELIDGNRGHTSRQIPMPQQGAKED